MSEKFLILQVFARFIDPDQARHNVSVKILGKGYADAYDQATQLIEDLKNSKGWVLQGDIFIRRVENE